MIKINLIHAVAFVWLGKFEAPDENWIHVSRRLWEYELMVVDSGTLYIACDGKEYEVHAGEYVLMPPSEHQYGYKASKCSFHWLHFIYNEAFNELDGDYIMLPEHGKLSNMERMVHMISELYTVWHTYEDRHYASFAMTSVLIELSHQSKSHEMEIEDCDRSASGSREIICRRIKQYISWECKVTTKVSDIAKYLGYSEKYMSHVFRAETGITIRQYLMEQLVEKSKTIMLNSKKNINEIAYDFGFSDPQNFSRMFKKITGISPSRFKENFLTLYEK